jgi:hypothetical protein
MLKSLYKEWNNLYNSFNNHLEQGVLIQSAKKQDNLEFHSKSCYLKSKTDLKYRKQSLLEKTLFIR